MTAPDGRPGRGWADRILSITLPFGILYAIWTALEVVQLLAGGERLSGLVIIRMLIQIGLAVCLIAGGILWRRDRRGGAA